MAATESKIRILFDGSAAGVIAASKQAQAAIRGLNDDSSKLAKAADKTGSGLLSISKGLAALGSAGGAVSTVGATAGAVAQLAPAALVLPGALLAGAAAMGTFKVATAGMGDALKAGLAGDMEKFAESTKNMAPNMQAAARSAAALKPQVDGLRRTVQDNFWAGFSGQVTDLGGRYLPILERGLGATATSFNGMFTEAARAAKSPFFTGSVTSILSGTSKTLGNMKGALGNVATGVVGLGAVGARYLPQLGSGIDDVAAKFRSWVEANSGIDGPIDDLIRRSITGLKDLAAIGGNVGSILGSIFRGLGTDLSSPLAGLRQLTGQVAEFLKTAEAQDGLRALGDTLRVVGDVVGKVVMAALRELMPTLVELAPAAQAVARGIGDFLVGAIQTVGPMLRDLAGFLSDNSGAVQELTPWVLGAVGAIKGLKVALEVKGWVDSALGALKLLGKTDIGDLGKAGGITWGKGFVGGLGLVGVGAAGTVFLDRVLPKDAATTHGSQAARDMLGEMAKTFSGEEGNIFRTWDVAKWVSNPISMAVEVGRRELMKLFAPANTAIPPLQFSAETGPARDQVAGFLNSLKGSSGTVEINGEPRDAAQALAEIIQRINDGQGEVEINGRKTPVEDALAAVIDQINAGVGLVNINGDNRLAGDALAEFLAKAQTSAATATLNADGAPAYETVGGWTRAAEGTVGMAALNANPAQANARVGEWVGGVSRARGTAALDANPASANQQLGGWTGRANTTTGTAKLNANPGQADGVTSGWQGAANRAVGTARLNADDSGARGTLGSLLQDWGGRVLTWTVRTITGFSGGGPVPGRAHGGPIYGPGTGTSDTAGLFALSKGEHVLTAREVAAAGGHAAIFQMRRSLLGGSGRVPRMTARSGRAASGGAITPGGAMTSGPLVLNPNITVMIGNEQFDGHIDTRVDRSTRATRRTVLAGAGTSW